jgi:hypothetical protein
MAKIFRQAVQNSWTSLLKSSSAASTRPADWRRELSRTAGQVIERMLETLTLNFQDVEMQVDGRKGRRKTWQHTCYPCNAVGGHHEGERGGTLTLARAFFYAEARVLLPSPQAVSSKSTVKLVSAAAGEVARNPALLVPRPCTLQALIENGHKGRGTQRLSGQPDATGLSRQLRTGRALTLSDGGRRLFDQSGIQAESGAPRLTAPRMLRAKRCSRRHRRSGERRSCRPPPRPVDRALRRYD